MWGLLKETYNQWSEHNPSQLSAALAFYAVFAIAPLLIIAVALAGLIFGVQATENQIVEAIGGLVGPSLAMAIQTTVKSAGRPQAGLLATLIGVVTLFIGAAGVVMQLKQSLNTIWEVELKLGSGVFPVIAEYLGAFLMVIGIGIFLLLSLAVSATVAALSRLTAPSDAVFGVWINFVTSFLHSVAFWQWVDLGVSFGMLTLLFALTYKILPSARIAWRDVWIGAAMTSILFTIGKWLIGIYLAHSSVTSAYGAAGSFIVILLWVYYSAQVFFFGAEFTHVHARRYGAGVKPSKNARLAAQRKT
jgi:membrane protein